MKKWFRKAVVVVLTTAMAMSVCIPAFANDTGNKTKSVDDYTLGEIQNMVILYFNDESIDLQIGTPEYYDYIVEQLLYGTDQNLKNHPQYDLIHAYMAEYKLASENEEFLQIEISTKGLPNEDCFYENNGFIERTLGEIKEENSLSLSEEELENSPIMTVSSYSGTAAANYAKKYALNYNSNYPSYNSDCTNFVSQCLYAGGISMIGTTRSPGTYDSTSNWYCKPFEVWHTNYYVTEYGLTTSWIRVRDLKTFLRSTLGKSTASIYQPTDLIRECSVGDVVQVVEKSTGSAYHSIIISSKTQSDARYCGHSTSRNDVSIKGIDTGTNSFILFYM